MNKRFPAHCCLDKLIYNVDGGVKSKTNRVLSAFLLASLLACLVLSSCQISGLTSGYNHLPKNLKERVIDYNGKIDSISKHSYVYTVTVGQVKDYLSTHKKVVVYDYTPFCKSSDCVSPLYLLNLCKSKGIDVLIISNIYDDLFLYMSKEFPMLMINTKESKSKWRGKYIDEFYHSLTGLTLKELDYASYHYFQDGAYVKSFEDINNIKSEF